MRCISILLAFLYTSSGHALWEAFQYEEYAAANSEDVSGSQWLNIGYFYEACKFPVLQIIDTHTNPSKIPRGTKIPVTLRVDGNEPWEWSASVEDAHVMENVYVSIKAPITSNFIEELIEGEMLRAKTGSETTVSWQLKGATKALSQAFRICIQTANDRVPGSGLDSYPEGKGYF